MERFGLESSKQSSDFVASVLDLSWSFDDCSKLYHWQANLAKKSGFTLHFELTDFDSDLRDFSMG